MQPSPLCHRSSTFGGSQPMWPAGLHMPGAIWTCATWVPGNACPDHSNEEQSEQMQLAWLRMTRSLQGACTSVHFSLEWCDHVLCIHRLFQEGAIWACIAPHPGCTSSVHSRQQRSEHGQPSDFARLRPPVLWRPSQQGAADRQWASDWGLRTPALHVQLLLNSMKVWYKFKQV